MAGFQSVTGVGGSGGHHPVLLILDFRERPTSRFLDVVRLMMDRMEDQTGPLHVLLFIDDPQQKLASELEQKWTGPVEVISGKGYLHRVGHLARISLSEFTAELRHRLVAVAQDAGGPSWGRYFGEMWWYTHLSEKNSPADGIWWDCLRLESIRQRLAEVSYVHCLFVGQPVLCDMTRQLCATYNIGFSAYTFGRDRIRWLRLFAKRVLGGAFFVVTVVATRLIHHRNSDSEENREGKVVLAYSWIEFWAQRFGTWVERYYGDTLDRIERFPDLITLYAISVYGRPYVPLKQVVLRLWSLRRPLWQAIRFIPLEAQVHPWQVIAEYIQVRDVWKFWRMTRTSDFRNALRWKGIDVTKPFSKLLWESVFATWPHIKIQEKMVTKLTSDIQPAVSLVYSFEYVFGRAFLKGARQGGATLIIGMQHGPMTPMKFTYAGTPDERTVSRSGCPPLPEPDLYSVDGNSALRILGQRGIGADRIRVVGPPRLDSIWVRASVAARRTRFQRIPIRVLIAPGLHDMGFVASFALPVLLQDQRLTIIFKPHPKFFLKDDALLLEIPFLRERGMESERFLLIRDNDIYEWMEDVDILVGTYSSTVIEAIAFGLPIILLTSERTPDMSPFLMYDGAALTASDEKTLCSHVDRLIQDSDFREGYLRRLQKVLYEVYGEVDGAAAARLATLCCDLIAQGADNSKT